jgi:hypothetical protein
MSNLRNALVTEKTYYVDNQAYTADAGNLSAIEPGLDFTKSDASAQGVLPKLVKVGSRPDGVCLESDSESGSKFILVDIVAGAEAGTWYGKNVSCPANDSTAPSGFSKDAATNWG